MASIFPTIVMQNVWETVEGAAVIFLFLSYVEFDVCLLRYTAYDKQRKIIPLHLIITPSTLLSPFRPLDARPCRLLCNSKLRNTNAVRFLPSYFSAYFHSIAEHKHKAHLLDSSRLLCRRANGNVRFRCSFT